MADWYPRAVIGVSDVERAVDFYVERLGFTRAWSHVEDGETLITQVGREGFDLILSSQWPERVGKGLAFISLDPQKIDVLRQEFEQSGAAPKDGQWGYRLMVVSDPDGNELFFPYPADEQADL